jgi:integrase
MSETHEILDGKVKVYKRGRSSVWQCSTYLEGRNRRATTKHTDLNLAKDFAENWYFTQRGKRAAGELVIGQTFAQAAKRFRQEYEVMTDGERNAKYVEDHYARLRNHLVPFFGKMAVRDIRAGTVQDYRIFRLKNDPNFKPPSRSTMMHEIVTFRQVMKTALRQGWIDFVPDGSIPYRTSGKISHRAWFSPEEYRVLYTASRKHAVAAKGKSWQYSAEQMHDMILFLANTGVRPDELKRLEYRDVEIVRDESTSQTILEISVRGKRGVGYCKSMAGAVLPFQRLQQRNNPTPTDLIFPQNHKKQFNNLLDRLDLKFDREGSRRTFYSLRHSYISFRLLEGADIYQIAKNCRTSVEMIEKHYAVHLKNVIDASAINMRKPRRR